MTYIKRTRIKKEEQETGREQEEQQQQQQQQNEADKSNVKEMKRVLFRSFLGG